SDSSVGAACAAVGPTTLPTTTAAAVATAPNLRLRRVLPLAIKCPSRDADFVRVTSPSQIWRVPTELVCPRQYVGNLGSCPASSQLWFGLRSGGFTDQTRDRSANGSGMRWDRYERF